MNQRALYAILLALVLPLTAYFLVKGKTEKATIMPPHYYYDTVLEVVKKDKRTEDTVWHSLPDFSLLNQDNKKVTLDSLKGKILVTDFFFTHCPSICPTLTKNMKRLAESINSGEKVGDKTNKQVQFLSFSIDPERDTVERLKYWASRFQVDPVNWWLLTGEKKTIYSLAKNDFKVGIEDGHGNDTVFSHTGDIILIDSSRHFRGFYDGLDTVSLAKLSNDIVMLTLEKDPKEKSFFTGKIEFIALVFLIAILGVGIFLYFLRKK
jgi:protein SCO1